jgi:PAS domain-containing protein/DNA-binding CsgD family transcriptional regulator
MLIARVQDPALIAGLYEAAADATCWASTWAAVCRAFEAPSGLLFHQRNTDAVPRILASTNWGEQGPLLYAGFSREVDTQPHTIDNNIRYRTVMGQENVGIMVMDRDGTFETLCTPFAGGGAFHVLGANLPLGGTARAGIGLHRPIDAPAFGETDRAALDSVSQHLAAALRLSTQLENERQASSVRGAALDGLRHGAVVARADSTILFANDAAARMAEAGGLVLEDEGGHVTCEQADEATRLAHLVRDAAEGGEGGCARITRSGRRALLAAVVSPLAASADQEGAPTLALVSVRDLGDASDATETHLMELFGLTAAEAGILPQLLAGDSAALIAQSRGVQVATIRTQAARVLAKTGAANLRALASMVAALG